MKADIYLVQEQNVISDKSTLDSVSCLVLVSKKGHGTAEDQVLDKLLAAIKLDRKTNCEVVIGDVDNIDVNSFLSTYAIQNLLLFGFEKESLPFNANMNPYTVYELGELKILCSESISVLNSDGSKKKLLWNELKRMFLD